MERLVARSGVGPNDVVYEIGAGTGAVTALLARHAGRVIAIEIDQALCGRLQRRFAAWPNVTIRQADFLEHRLPRASFKVFANPPFDITAAIVTMLTTAAVPPDDVFLAVQREAADRYCGNPRETLASLLLLPFFDTTIVHRFSREDFVPTPGVDVVMLRLRKRGPPLVAQSRRQLYRDFVTASFTAWQPSIGAALRRQLGAHVARKLIADVGLDPERRPSGVSSAIWLELFGHFARLPSGVHVRVAGAEHRLSRQQRRLQKRHRTRAPRDDLIVSLRGEPYVIAAKLDEALAVENVGDRPGPRIVDRALEPLHRHDAAVR